MKNSYFRYTVKIALVLFLFVCSNTTVSAARYYVSSSTGDDNRTLAEARNAQTPWRTIERVNAAMGNLQAGDQILFKRGEVFPGMLTVNISGSPGSPVVFSAYGDGALPELTGFVTLSGWQQKGGNVWETPVPSEPSYLNTVTINGAAKAVGRYPNATAVNQGYLSYNSFNANVSITDSRLASQDWSGGQVVMRKTRWIIDRSTISSQSGTTLNYKSPTGYPGAKGYGYFIQNHPNTLDTEGEWYYRNGRIGVFTAGNPKSSTVRAGVIETIVRIANQSNLSFENLRLSGAAVSGFEITSSQNIRISGCEVLFSGRNGVNATGTDRLTIENNTIAHTNSIALSVNGGNNTVLRENQIRGSGTNAGMGDAGDGTFEGITIGGDNNLIANNTIDSTGYVPLNFNGNNVIVKNNIITNFALTKDDGGGIYTWNNGQNPPVNTGRVITGNIVLNGIGAPGGTDNPDKLFAHGIYIDDNAGQIEISGNTVGNCATSGMFIHNAHDLVIKQNTLYNNAVQLLMEHDNVAAEKPIYNCMVTGNVFFAKQASQLAVEYKTKDNDITNFGNFDNNYYYRPLDNDLTIGVLQQVNGVYSYNTLSLESWKALYGKDGNSTKSGHSIPAYAVTKVTGSNQFSNGAFESNAGGLYAYASANNCVTGWDNGHLDGGALKVSFSSTSNSANYGSVIIGIGTVTAGKTYRLKFSMLGSSGKAITAYMRQSGGGYQDLSERKSATIGSTRQEKEFLFTATTSEGNASIVFDVPEQPSPLYLDNIKLEQVDATLTNPDQYISFLFNTSTSTKSYSTTQSYDAAGTSYPNSIKLSAFSSAVLVQEVASTTLTSAVEENKCSSTGTILREQWDNVGGTNIADIPLQKTPSSTSQLTSFEGPKDIADNYGSRIRGYICPPQTGDYTFWVTGDDATELWLSTDDQPANKIRIAYIDGWTNYQEWGKYPSQKSALITLEAGKKYYVEALQKEAGGGDNLSVQWQLPNATMETPIAGSHLSPFLSSTPATTVTPATPVIAGTGSISREQWDNVGGNTITDIPLQKTPSSTSKITSFEGPKDITDNYGSRIRGYVFAPQTGNYTFWIASDDAGELWLSTDDKPANKVRIANVDGWTNYREWNKSSSQKSIQIMLQSGQKYYIEALQKDGGCGDNLSVQWQLPDATMETPIAGSHLSPFVAEPIAEQTISFAAIASKTAGDAAFGLTATASSGLPVSFSIVSGPATVSGSTVALTGDGTVIIAANQAGNASFSAAKTVTQSFVVVPASTACSATGTILYEMWRNTSGNNLSDFSFQPKPTSTSELNVFEGPTNMGDSYASRIRGYICAPQTGNYTFWLAGDDAAELYISTDDNPNNKVRIANLLSWTNFREWNKYASQKSAEITLQASKKYYIEVVHKQGGGGDNLSVQWQLPNGAIESPLPGKYLSPYQAGQINTSSLKFSSNNAVSSPAVITVTEPLSKAGKQGLYVYPNPVSQQSNVEFMLTESGQTNIALFNSNGQLISKLFTGATQANTKKSFVLDAGNLQNGVYLLRLISGKNTLTKKVMVLK